MVLFGVLWGLPAGPLPCVTFPETVTSSDGGWAPNDSSSLNLHVNGEGYGKAHLE